MLSDQDTIGQNTIFLLLRIYILLGEGGGGGRGMLRDCTSMLGIRVVYRGSHLRGV